MSARTSEWACGCRRGRRPRDARARSALASHHPYLPRAPRLTLRPLGCAQELLPNPFSFNPWPSKGTASACFKILFSTPPECEYFAPFHPEAVRNIHMIARWPRAPLALSPSTLNKGTPCHLKGFCAPNNLLILLFAVLMRSQVSRCSCHLYGGSPSPPCSARPFHTVTTYACAAPHCSTPRDSLDAPRTAVMLD